MASHTDHQRWHPTPGANVGGNGVKCAHKSHGHKYTHAYLGLPVAPLENALPKETTPRWWRAPKPRTQGRAPPPNPPRYSYSRSRELRSLPTAKRRRVVDAQPRHESPRATSPTPGGGLQARLERDGGLQAKQYLAHVQKKHAAPLEIERCASRNRTPRLYQKRTPQALRLQRYRALLRKSEPRMNLEPLSPKSGVEGRVRIRNKIGGAVQAVGTIRLGVRVDAVAARAAGSSQNLVSRYQPRGPPQSCKAREGGEIESVGKTTS